MRFDEIHLLRENLPFCTGCSNCFRIGHEKCPHYSIVGKIIEEIEHADGIIVVSTTYVLPKGFVRIRHYGILSCRCKKEKMNLCRRLLNCIQYISQLRNKTVAEKLLILYKKDICKCEACGGKLSSFRLSGAYSLTG